MLTSIYNALHRRLLLILTLLYCSISGLLLADNIALNKTIPLDILRYNNINYISLNEFVDTHGLYTNYYESKDKLEVLYNRKKMYFSPGLSYCKMNGQIYNLTHPVLYTKNTFYVPVNTFYKSIEKAGFPFRIIKQAENLLYVIKNLYNINQVSVQNKKNGTVITLHTATQFNAKNISGSISSSNWLNITIPGGVLDSLNLNTAFLQKPILKIETMQLKESAQISLLLENQVEDFDIIARESAITFLLRNSIADNAEKIIELRKKWLIDTIVIDPGHGGKDPGALGHRLQEKDITLDIAKKLGNMLERNLGINVIYTREEDVFVPLWKRTKLANSVGGKLFISLHVNATAKSPHVHGFETYLLRPGKTDQAIEVVKRENAVIELEKEEYDYADLKNENYIIASMAQNSFMKESEELAALINQHMAINLKNVTKDRGVKQAGFHVLVGATMPNVLVEVGFLSNKKEAANLSKSYYRRNIAESIYRAILDFKLKHEKPLLK